MQLDETDRRIVNELQGGFPICEHPYAEAAAGLGVEEHELLERLRRLVDEGWLSRFGPMINAERMGGGLTLAAMAVPEERFDTVAAQVNRHGEVAHNYAREHDLNMWFVLATERPEDIDRVVGEIEAETGLEVINMPKQEEFYLGLRLEI